MTHWRFRIIVGDAFLVVALVFLALLLNIQSVLFGSPNLVVGLVSIAASFGWIWIAWSKGLFLSLHERPWAVSFYALLWLVLAVLCTLAITSSGELLNPGDVDPKATLQGVMAELDDQDVPSWWRPGLWLLWLQTVGWAVVRLALGFVLVVAASLAVATLVVSSLALYVADLKTGVLVLLVVPIVLLGLLAYVSVDFAPAYTLCALGCLSLGLATGANYENLTVNGDLSRVSPEYERIYVALRRSPGFTKGLIEVTKAREIAAEQVGEDKAKQILDFLADRDGVLIRVGEDYRLGREKKLTVGTALMAVASFFYLLNPGFGFVDLIPDSLPVAGNVDEAAATALLLRAVGKWREDMKTIKGSKAKPTPRLEAP